MNSSKPSRLANTKELIQSLIDDLNELNHHDPRGFLAQTLGLTRHAIKNYLYGKAKIKAVDFDKLKSAVNSVHFSKKGCYITYLPLMLHRAGITAIYKLHNGLCVLAAVRVRGDRGLENYTRTFSLKTYGSYNQLITKALDYYLSHSK